MDIGGLSISMNQAKVSEMVGISVMKMAMDSSQQNGDAVTQMINTSVKAMEMSVTPHLGNTIDVKL